MSKKVTTPKSPKVPKATAAPKSESSEWVKALEKLNAKRELFESGKMPGYDYNTYVLPLIHTYDTGNRSPHLLSKINQL
jgi:hypothetical protein